MRFRTLAFIVTVAVIVAACGAPEDDTADGADPSAPSSTVQVTPLLPNSDPDAAPASEPTEFEARSLPPLPPSTVSVPETASPSTAPPTTSPPSTVSPTTRPPTAPPTTEHEPFAVEWNSPSGSFELAPDDIVALTDGGALVLFGAVSSGSPTTEILVADVEPALGDAEIDAVGGVIAGALVFGTCCGDDAGLWSLSSTGGRLQRFAAGRLPAYDRDRDWLVALDDGDDELLVHDVPSELVTSPSFEAGDDAGGVRDVVWAADDESWVVSVGDDTQAGQLVRIEARPPFTELATADLDALFPGAETAPTIAGLGPTGDVGVWSRDGNEVVLKFVDPTTLTERTGRDRTLSATATSIRIGSDGGSLIWIDGRSLHYLPLFADERTLGEGFVAAWFVG